MNAIDGKKVYILAALWALGVGGFEAGVLHGTLDWSTLFPYLFEGGFAAAFRHAIAKMGS